MRKKNIFASVLAAMMVLSAVGCSETETRSTPNSTNASNITSKAPADNTDSALVSTPQTNSNANTADTVELKDDGDKLTILSWTGADLEAMIKLFCQETGHSESEITWTQVGTSGGEASNQYTQYLSGDGDADLLCLEADWILKYLNDDSITAPLSALGIDESAYSDAFPYTVAIGNGEDGVLKGASWQCAPGGFVYRTDLAKEYLGVDTPEQMQELVSDWDKFADTAKKVQAASEGKTSLTATEGGLWQVYSANRTKPWVVDNKLVLDNAADFIQIAKDFSDNKYITDVTQWSPSWYTVGQDGTTMGYFFSTWCLTNSEGGQLYQAEGIKEIKDDGTLVGSESAGKYAICEGPTSYFWGGTWLAPTVKCDNKSLAKEFVEFFTTNAETMQKYAEISGDFVNNKTAMDNIIASGANKNALLGGQDQFAVLKINADKINMEGLITKYDNAIKEDFNNAVQEYIKGTAGYDSVEATLEKFQDKVAADIPDLQWD